MKLRVKLDDQIFDVEVGNPNERPILVNVNGATFEVWPEASVNQPLTSALSQPKQIASQPEVGSPTPRVTGPAPTARPPANSAAVVLSSVRAPIPGVITAILVCTGAEVEVGQELCKLEAMKMNNSIRANRSGIIENIHISIGQHVKHNETLMDFVK
jgi:biotin carboxyl carrier protein